MDDFLRRFEQHVNKPENLRKRHVKIERHYGANRHRPRHYR